MTICPALVNVFAANELAHRLIDLPVFLGLIRLEFMRVKLKEGSEEGQLFLVPNFSPTVGNVVKKVVFWLFITALRAGMDSIVD